MIEQTSENEKIIELTESNFNTNKKFSKKFTFNNSNQNENKNEKDENEKNKDNFTIKNLFEAEGKFEEYFEDYKKFVEKFQNKLKQAFNKDSKKSELNIIEIPQNENKNPNDDVLSDNHENDTDSEENKILEFLNKVEKFKEVCNRKNEFFNVGFNLMSHLVCFDLTEEYFYMSDLDYKIEDMKMLAFLFYVQRIFLIKPCLYAITCDNLIGGLSNVTPLHTMLYKNYRKREMDCIGVYHEIPHFNFLSKKKVEELKNNYNQENYRLKNLFEDKSYFVNVKLSKMSLISQAYNLFKLIKKCNIPETDYLIYEYIELIKLVMKLIRSVSNLIDFEFIKNVAISIEYIKQRFNFKITDDDLFHQLITIIDASLYEMKKKFNRTKN